MKSILKNIDYATLLLCFALASMGILVIYSSSYNEDFHSILSLNMSYGKQIMWAGISFVIGSIILLLEPDFIRKNTNSFYGVTVFLLVLVLLIGSERGGAKAWFGIGSFGIQPAEFVKIAVSLMLAKKLSESNVSIRKNSTQLQLATIIFIPIFLILLQPDLGTVLVFTAFVLVLYREGLSGNIMLYGILGIITTVLSLISSQSTTSIFGWEIHSNYVLGFIILLLSVLIFIYINIFFYKRYRRKRIIKLFILSIVTLAIIPTSTHFFNKIPNTSYQKQRMQLVLGLLDREELKTSLQEEKLNKKIALASGNVVLIHQNKIKTKELEKLLKTEAKVGYNIHQALSAIGSGESIGKGYKQATLANNKFKQVPEQSTDFIFCTFAEEWGFWGGFILFALFTTLIIRLIILAERQRSTFARVYIYSVACILFLHFTINIGMVMGVAPIIGIPLPFFSYGGSSLLAFSIMIFIALKLDAERLDAFR